MLDPVSRSAPPAPSAPKQRPLEHTVAYNRRRDPAAEPCGRAGGGSPPRGPSPNPSRGPSPRFDRVPHRPGACLPPRNHLHCIPIKHSHDIVRDRQHPSVRQRRDFPKARPSMLTVLITPVNNHCCALVPSSTPSARTPTSSRAVPEPRPTLPAPHVLQLQPAEFPLVGSEETLISSNP